MGSGSRVCRDPTHLSKTAWDLLHSAYVIAHSPFIAMLNYLQSPIECRVVERVVMPYCLKMEETLFVKSIFQFVVESSGKETVHCRSAGFAFLWGSFFFPY